MTEWKPEPEPNPAPDRLTGWYCPKCGQFRMYGFRAHYSWGSMCRGELVQIDYRRVDGQ